jgi:hypothetical protein
VESINQGETAMSEEVRDFHFNVNVRAGSGSRAQMANNEDSFLRAMEIQERKRAKKDLENPKQEEIIEAPPEETIVVTEEEVVEAPPVAVEEAPVVETPEPVKAAPAPKPSGGGVPGPTPRRDFTSEERAGMMKRAKAHAAEVAARKNK